MRLSCDKMCNEVSTCDPYCTCDDATPYVAKSPPGEWKDLFRDLVRANRAKHDLYLLRDGDADQNAVARAPRL